MYDPPMYATAMSDRNALFVVCVGMLRVGTGLMTLLRYTVELINPHARQRLMCLGE